MIELLHTYIRDLSIESLDPIILMNNNNNTSKPLNIDISSLNIKHRKLSEDLFEVLSSCKVLVSSENNTQVMAFEIEYGGLFKIKVQKEKLARTIYVDCANIIYPFLRSEVASISVKTGGNAILLPFLNFEQQFNEMDLDVVEEMLKSNNKKLH